MPELPERCPRCARPTSGVVGVGEKKDGTIFIYCSCGQILDGEDEDSRAEMRK